MGERSVRINGQLDEHVEEVELDQRDGQSSEASADEETSTAIADESTVEAGDFGYVPVNAAPIEHEENGIQAVAEGVNGIMLDNGRVRPSPMELMRNLMLQAAASRAPIEPAVPEWTGMDSDEEAEDMAIRRQQEEAIRAAEEADKARREAPLSQDNRSTILRAMQSISLPKPGWADVVTDEELLENVMKKRNPSTQKGNE